MGWKVLLQLLLLIGLFLSAHGEEPLSQWDVADSKIKRLPPRAFSELPRKILSELESRGCTIPQVYYNSKAHNIIKGEFALKNRLDWAVLCSKDRISSILVFWDGSTEKPSELAKKPDRDRLQGIGGGKIGYSRLISVVEQKDLTLRYKRFLEPKPPFVGHAAVGDHFVEKFSVLHYFFDGKWWSLTAEPTH